MIELKNIQTLDRKRVDLSVLGGNQQIDASHLTLFPALIDPHVHFRVPGAEHKETWETAARAALAGGITTVLDMPNNTPSCISRERLLEKIERIEGQLKATQIPLRYKLYLGADQDHLEEIGNVKAAAAGLKIYMGSSTGDLLMDNAAALEKAFRIAGENDFLVAVHAEDEEMIRQRTKEMGAGRAALHSVIRNAEVAAKAVDLAIRMAEKYQTRLYIAHISTRDEIALIRSAKKRGLPIFAETTPHHLFLNTDDYERIGTLALVNPPLREKLESAALFEAIHDGTIDTIGSDHAPHTVEEKKKSYGSAPSGFPSIELYFSLLLNAALENKISFQEIVSLTRTQPEAIFRLPPNDDWVLVDLARKKTVDDASLQTKAKWSPYAGKVLQGWPRYVILRGRLYDVESL